MAMRRFAHISLLSATNARKCFSTAPKTKSLPFFVSTKNTRMCFSTVPNTNPPPKKESTDGVVKEEWVNNYFKNLQTEDQVKRNLIKQIKILFDVKDDNAPRLRADAEGLHVFVDAVGFTNKDLNIQVKDDHLFVKGETKTESGPKQVDEAIQIPTEWYNPADATATISNGELKVSFPCSKERKNRCFSFSIDKWV